MSEQSLFDYINSGGSEQHFQQNFHAMLEHHVGLLRISPLTQTIPVIPAVANQYAGDFFGLLSYLRVSTEHHWIVMRVNNLHSPLEYKSDQVNIFLPDIATLNDLFTIFTSSANLNIG